MEQIDMQQTEELTEEEKEEIRNFNFLRWQEEDLETEWNVTGKFPW